jgi:polysaccharide biosynthesis/export protein
VNKQWKWMACVALLVVNVATAEDVYPRGAYRVQPGDVLQVSVWREPDMQLETVVRPDGGISVPLVGEVSTKGKTVDELRTELTQRLARFMPDMTVNVSVKQLLGNKVYVIGKVNRPGEFVLNTDIDVMQALSMAAGTAKFADLKDIKILRRNHTEQQVFNFDYREVEAGENLDQNIVLHSGDVVVVP